MVGYNLLPKLEIGAVLANGTTRVIKRTRGQTCVATCGCSIGIQTTFPGIACIFDI